MIDSFKGEMKREIEVQSGKRKAKGTVCFKRKQVEAQGLPNLVNIFAPTRNRHSLGKIIKNHHTSRLKHVQSIQTSERVRADEK